ncbi:unnamed protein product [Thlaspi arvense]|uniref:PWWP domain-containing protein n=1 Tax=Thlaspi arvense TaxID=13288 RepID=A0AAU9T067_THLAR|nr:unnamed protein product [Thlaspi arvense]
MYMLKGTLEKCSGDESDKTSTVPRGLSLDIHVAHFTCIPPIEMRNSFLDFIYFLESSSRSPENFRRHPRSVVFSFFCSTLRLVSVLSCLRDCFYLQWKCTESDSDAVSRFESGVGQTSETLAAAGTLLVKLAGVERKCCVSSGNEKSNRVSHLKKGTDSVDATRDLDMALNGSESENDSDAESEGFRGKRDFDGPRKRKPKHENLGGAVSAGSASANENLKLSGSDLVWGRVRSYPWWPGQLFDASSASKTAMKHFKKGKSLVAYFGDRSFAWNDASRIKPFHEHFSQMEKQSYSPVFRHAVDCALEEVSRRVEFGLSCVCVSEDAYSKLETQNINNPGIREHARVRDVGDKLSSVLSFEPAKLLEYVKQLACLARYEETDKLQFVIHRAQLLASQQWTSYLIFPKYETFTRSVESAAPLASLLEPNTNEEESPKRRKTDIKDHAEHKQRLGFEDATDEKRKDKALSDIVANKVFGSGSIVKLDGKSKVESEKREESASKNSDEENNLSVGNKVQKVCFRIGAFPLRMESEMVSLTSTLKVDGKSYSGKKLKVESEKKEEPASKNSDEENNFSVGNKVEKVCFGIGAFPFRMESEMVSLTSTPKVQVENKKRKKPEQEELSRKETSSRDEMISSLHSAKTGKGIPGSFSIHSNYEDFEEFIKEISYSDLNHDSKKVSITETSETWNVKDPSEEQVLPDEMLSSLAKTGKAIPESISIDPSRYQDLDKFIEELSCSSIMDDPKKASITETSEPKASITETSEPKATITETPEQLILPVNKDLTGSGSKDQTGLKDCPEDSSAPNALILKFSDSGFVPTEEKLNIIFNRYGPLRESETPIMKKGKRAKVVFKRGEDAKTAFSSSGKYSIFGPSLLSYSLKYVSPKAQQNNITN